MTQQIACFEVGDRVTWQVSPQGGSTTSKLIPGVVLKLTGKRVRIKVARTLGFTVALEE